MLQRRMHDEDVEEEEEEEGEVTQPCRGRIQCRDPEDPSSSACVGASA